ncbi:5'-3' exonuclease H3TH domain-containing protein [Actinoplanes oblitus]|uniref:5'-3' exonuclease n=1 Tax=Actinoplanes oblitus TaxID=3040509 RepID=A0ABY8WTT1_9ACTN|nr:5'-3' exonuclease H3TH domain-containing protein [Actinoplanes oblitus]WIN00064.1 5'-3' exonuclease H3TH domain-containing protein [Actinoplanes oblitus]
MGAVPSRPDPSVPLLLVDGHNLLWRATFGFPAKIESKDKTRDITGLFGFFALLRVAVREELPHPPEIIVVFDGQHGTAARKATDVSYKAQRPIDENAMAPIRQLPAVKDALDKHGIAWVELDDQEADDVIATLAAADLDRRVYIMSGDRDFYQLIDERVTVLNTAMHRGKRHVNAQAVLAKFRVTPAQWADFRAMTGDPADNIPGVRGIGPGTAATLLADGQTLETLHENGRMSGSRTAALSDAWNDVLRWRTMIRLNQALPLDIKPTGEPSAPLPTPAAVVEAIGQW